MTLKLDRLSDREAVNPALSDNGLTSALGI